MAVAQMKCPNCGGTMRLVNNQFVCSNCRTMLLNIVDAKIDADVTVMSPDEFARQIEESKRQFVVKIDDNLKVFDVNTMVINKQIKDATMSLERGEFEEVITILKSVPNDILSAERLRYLAEFKVKNEYELSFYDGYIDENTHYKNIISLADEQTRATYQKIAAYCREQYDTKRSIETEITEVKKLLDVKLYQEAIAYTKEMCKKYPQTALSWAYACEVKCAISGNYNGKFEFSMMVKCPDYSESIFPTVLKEKIYNFTNLSKEYEKKYKNYTKNLAVLVWCMWGWLAALLFYTSIIRQNTVNVELEIFVSFLSLFILVLPFVIFVLIVLSSKNGIIFWKSRRQYDSAVNLLPDIIVKKYGVNCSFGKKSFYYFAIAVWFVTIMLTIRFLARNQLF